MFEMCLVPLSKAMQIIQTDGLTVFREGCYYCNLTLVNYGTKAAFWREGGGGRWEGGGGVFTHTETLFWPVSTPPAEHPRT